MQLRVRGWREGVARELRRARAAWTGLRAFKRRNRGQHWPRSPLRFVTSSIGWILAAGMLFLAVLSALTVVSNLVFHEPFLDFTMKGVKRRCDQTGFACTVASSIFFTAGPLLIGSFVFVFARLRLVRRPFLKEARERPTELVETAGEMLGEVVGRDDICNVLQSDLHDREERRPHVVVGGVGIGKTAVLVRLTELLARRGAVPVPIRLRDATEELDFLEMARQAFMRGTQSSQWLAAEAERAWRLFCRTDKIVVIADGLEEALADSPDKRIDQERDQRVRVAVSQARKRGYPLVIASRPHDALSALDAALLPLEPLSHEAALEYIEGGSPISDKHRIGRLVETANVVEAPLYLQILRELHENGQLRPKLINTRGADRVLLRMNLMQLWVEALITGNLDRTARVPLQPAQRAATIWHLAALACCGLAGDKIQVTFDMFETRDPKSPAGKATYHYPTLAEALTRKVGDLSTERTPLSVNMQVAASNGARLGLVEPRTDGVRFTHSIMQAYLGSKLIGEALKDPEFIAAFQAPGRELLVALEMFSRSSQASEPAPASHPSWRAWLREQLCEAAKSAPTAAKALELLAAAVEVDSVDEASDHSGAAHALVSRWKDRTPRDDATRAAKLVGIARTGEAARLLTQTSPPGACGLYQRLQEISWEEEAYPIRLAAVQEIGTGGDVAFGELQARFRDDISEDFAARQGQLKSATGRREVERRYAVQAWLLPMLVGSVGEGDEPPKRLEEWLEVVGKGMPLSIEAALAQGFKFAANRRPEHPHEEAKTRAYLAARAAEMLQSADFWFSRVTLLHALCLWGLSGTLHAPRGFEERRNFRAVVDRWIARDDARPEHRFVLEAANLVVDALESKQPERFIWIDESGIATTVGSRSRQSAPHAMRRLWIPPSAGWLALDTRAQQLVADILILLTLASERGDNPKDRIRNLERINRVELPHCLTQERREHLRPTERAGVTQRQPGDTCKSGCLVAMCPYPPKGELPFELGEAFCRHQRALVRRPARGKRADWQAAPRPELGRFWREMEGRART